MEYVALATPLTANRPPGVDPPERSPRRAGDGHGLAPRSSSRAAAHPSKAGEKSRVNRVTIALPLTRGRATRASDPSPTHRSPGGSSVRPRRDSASPRPSAAPIDVTLPSKPGGVVDVGSWAVGRVVEPARPNERRHPESPPFHGSPPFCARCVRGSGVVTSFPAALPSQIRTHESQSGHRWARSSSSPWT